MYKLFKCEKEGIKLTVCTFYIYICVCVCVCAYGAMDIVVGNGHSNASSNPG